MTMVSPTTSRAASQLDTRRLMRWHQMHGRHELPWRQTTDRYAVLVSEVMLQQTQVARVVPYWLAWMDRWPTVATLAAENRAEVIRAWSGLGYNNRAVRLHEAAQICIARHGGDIPASELELRTLPGVGLYTANAVLCFSGTANTIPLDTNIARVLARTLSGVAQPRAVGARQLGELAGAMAPGRDARRYAAALMDLGATVCTASSPNCLSCPLAASCAWRDLGHPEPGHVQTRMPRFEDTARWARGRIVDRLRKGPATEVELGCALPERHRQHFADYLDALARDGLIERNGNFVSLAGDQTMSIASPKL